MFPEVYKITLLKQHESGFALDPVTQAYLARIASNGGTISESSTLAFDNFAKELRATGLLPKIQRLNPILGNDDTACRTPAIALIGNNLATTISGTNTWVEATGVNVTSESVIDEGLEANVDAYFPTANASYGYYYRVDAVDGLTHRSNPSTDPSRAGVVVSRQRGSASFIGFLVTGQGAGTQVNYGIGSSPTGYGLLQSSTRYDVESPAGSVDVYLYHNGVLGNSITGGTPTTFYTETTRPVTINVGTYASDLCVGYWLGQFLDEDESAAMATAWNNFQAAMGRSPF